MVSLDQQHNQTESISPSLSPTSQSKQSKEKGKKQKGVRSIFGGFKSSSKAKNTKGKDAIEGNDQYGGAVKESQQNAGDKKSNEVKMDGTGSGDQSRSVDPTSFDQSRLESILNHQAPDLMNVHESPDLADLRPMFETLINKEYLSGYIYKLNDLNELGRPLPSRPANVPYKCKEDIHWGGEWAKWWVELRGAVLYLWRVPDEIAASSYYPSPSVSGIMKNEVATVDEETVKTIKSAFSGSPLRIPIFSSTVELLPYGFQPVARVDRTPSPLPPIPYDNFLALSTTGSNLFHLAVRSSIAANAWTGAIRLASFEAGKLCEHFSLRILGRPGVRASWGEFGLVPFKTATGSVGVVGAAGSPGIHFEGSVAVRHPYVAEWREYYAVVSNLSEPPRMSTTVQPPAIPQQSSNNRDSTSLKKLFGVGRKKGQGVDASNKSTPASSPNSSASSLAVPTVMATRRPDISFYSSAADFQSGTQPLFKLEHARHCYLDILSPGSDRPAIVKVEGVLTKKTRIRPLSMMGVTATKSLGYPGSGFDSEDPLEEILSGKDARPQPQFIHIVSNEAPKWVMAISGAFQLDTDLMAREKEISDGEIGFTIIEPSPEVEETKEARELRKQKQYWGLLYLSPPEIAGLAMSPETLGEVKVRFAKVLGDKVATKKAGFLNQWADAVSTGILARTEFEAQEVKSKVVGLVQWLSDKVPQLPGATPQTGQASSESGSQKMPTSVKSASIKSAERTIKVSNGNEESISTSLEQKRLSKVSIAHSAKSATTSVKEKIAEAPGGDESKDKGAPAETDRVEEGDIEAQAAEKAASVKSVEIPKVPEAPPIVNNQIVPTDLVLVAVPMLQPDGQWAWQYQFANAANVQNTMPGAHVVAAAPALPIKADEENEEEQESEEEGSTGTENDSDEDDEESDEEDESEDEANAPEGRAVSTMPAMPVAPFNPAFMPFGVNMPLPMMGMMGMNGMLPAVHATEGTAKSKSDKKKKDKKKKAEDEEEEMEDSEEKADDDDSNAGSVSEDSDTSGTDDGSGSEDDSEEDDEDARATIDPLQGLPNMMMMPGMMPGLVPGMMPGMMLPGLMTPMPGMDMNTAMHQELDLDEDEDEELEDDAKSVRFL
jgi:hypothetical protein